MRDFSSSCGASSLQYVCTLQRLDCRIRFDVERRTLLRSLHFILDVCVAVSTVKEMSAIRLQHENPRGLSP